MSSDTPAVVATLVLAVVLIGASAPFTVLWWGEGTTQYDITWEKAEEGSTTVRLQQAPGSQQGSVPVDDRFVAELRLEAQSQCANTPGLGAGAATVQYAVSVTYENGTTRQLPGGSGTFTCGMSPVVIPIHGEHPDLAAREVESSDGSTEREAARAAVWDADLVGSLNETSTYTLTLSSTRAQGSLPPQLQQASTFDVAMELQVWRWEALVNEAGDEEAVR